MIILITSCFCLLCCYCNHSTNSGPCCVGNSYFTFGSGLQLLLNILTLKIQMGSLPFAYIASNIAYACVLREKTVRSGLVHLVSCSVIFFLSTTEIYFTMENIGQFLYSVEFRKAVFWDQYCLLSTLTIYLKSLHFYMLTTQKYSAKLHHGKTPLRYSQIYTRSMNGPRSGY